MMGVEIKSLVIRGEEGAAIKAYHDNMGEPYRTGVTIWVAKDGEDNGSGVFLQTYDLDNLIAGLQAIRKTLR
ncbi:hypothetical protein J4G48_0040790 [Bradyrhizobium barranii subsp. apii]|uniref:hypothetical protein n=1 Tax=Bradyrhizobium barranii TaxID=2992140 RepID=UPI001AA0ECD1|nr:hypothetical protein [Bradyrhizobium barranii]UPT95495.1 hypothetical protein J4G48_0040790 [Bradyrhizobium barranii subsp. apii]